MRTKLTILLSLLIFGFISCEKFQSDVKVVSLIDSKWTLTQMIDNSTKKVTDFPSEIDDFEIIFRKNGKIDLPNYCYYSYGTFKIIAPDSLKISNIGPGTEKYCLPDISMEWETKFINGIIASKTYSINNNILTIKSYDNMLLFSYKGRYDSNKGKILFCTNEHIMNCIFEIEVSINGQKVGILNAETSYSDNDCYCENSAGIGLLISKDIGKYTYSAKEIKCKATNINNLWTGEIDVNGDTCTIIFLDITKNLKCTWPTHPLKILFLLSSLQKVLVPHQLFYRLI